MKKLRHILSSDEERERERGIYMLIICGRTMHVEISSLNPEPITIFTYFYQLTYRLGGAFLQSFSQSFSDNWHDLRIDLDFTIIWEMGHPQSSPWLLKNTCRHGHPWLDDMEVSAWSSETSEHPDEHPDSHGKSQVLIGKPSINGSCSMAIEKRYPLVNIHIAIENGPVEIVSCPMKHGGIVHRFL